jgi:hypothetical protein
MVVVQEAGHDAEEPVGTGVQPTAGYRYPIVVSSG